MGAFDALKQACMDSLVLAFTDYTRDFFAGNGCLEGGIWEQFFPRSKTMDGSTQWAYSSWVLTTHEKNYHSMKLEVSGIKMGHCGNISKNILLYQSYLVKTDNNPLTYIMATPNLDATGHRWVSTLAKYDFRLEYQKG